MKMKSFLLQSLSALLIASLHIPPSAHAADGPAPASQQRRVLSRVHADAISLLAENGGLTLGSRAEIDGNLGVRLDPDLMTFNVEEAARTTVPNLPSFSFLGAPGSDVWLAPETNPAGALLWPGFSTEGVPTGFLDGNVVTLRLEAVTGPGTLHVFQNDAFGVPIRRFNSTGTSHREWIIPRGTHAHANWAFSAAGAYTLTFVASGTTNGVPVSATQNYSFVVGNLPAAVATTTTLAASTNSSIHGTAVTLTSTVAPANADGWVEFRDGSNVLGHDLVNAGSAALSTTNLALGARSVTARFVPQWLNDFSASTSAPVTITVTEPSGVPITVAGVAPSYQPGNTLTATLSGYTLATGQQVRWLIRRVGTTFGGSILATAASLTYTNILDISWDGYEISAQVRQGTATVATTGWTTISVAPMPGIAPISTQFPAGIQYAGDVLVFPLSRALAEGETVRLAWLTEVGTRWQVSPTVLVGNTLQTRAIWTQMNFTQIEFAIQIIRDGVAVAQSARVSGSVIDRQVQVAGLQGVYRPGQNLNATAQVIPPMDGLIYRWTVLTNTSGETIVNESAAPEALTLNLTTTLGMNGKLIKFYAFADDLVGTNRVMISYWFTRLAVSDTTDQIFVFSPLSDHYHQGYPINLVVGADPQPAPNDTIVWEWRWPGTEWANFPSAAGLSKSLVAEQALNGLEVRATLQFADNSASKLAGPVTIFVDDHGFPANQKPTITGSTNVVAGNLVTLTRELPGNGATILTTHRWERKAAGASEFTVVPGETNATLSFLATLADDGAQYRVSILKPNGDLAYGPSPAVMLDLESRPTITPIASRFVPVGTVLAAIDFTVGDVETAPSELLVTATSSNQAVFPNGNIVLGGSGASRTLSLTSNLNQPGTTTITVTVTDAAGLQASANFELTVGNPIRATFDRSVGIAFGTDPIDMRLVDIDNDGDLDVLYTDRIKAISILRNKGDGTFGEPVPLPAITVSDIHVADINGDGLLDILTSVYVDDTYAETAVAFWRNVGSGGFSAQEIVPTTRTTDVVFLAGVGDIDGDGAKDIILSNSNLSGVVYSRNLGTGSFGPLTQIHASGYAWWSALSDVDRDGDLDVVRANNENGMFRLQLLRNSGAAVPAFTVEELASFGGNSLRSITIGDTDQDGLADIHLVKGIPSGSAVVVLRGSSDGSFRTPVVLASGPEFTDLKIGDIDVDGRPDLAVASRDRNQVLFAQNLGSGVFTDLQEFTTDAIYLNPGHEVVAIGDVDGDGRNDLVYMERFAKRIAWSRNRQGENITALKVPVSRSYLNGFPMTFDVFLGFNVRLNTAGGSPTLPVTIGSQAIQVPFVGQPNANTLRFRHLVQNADVDLDGIQVASSVALNGAIITDGLGLPLPASFLQFPSVDTTGIRVNGGAPYVTGITRLDATPATTNSVRYAVVFSEPVTGVTLDDFALDASGPVGAAITSSTGSGDSYVVTASIGSGDGTLKLRVLDDDSILDADSNPLGGVGTANGEFAYGQGYTVRSSTAPPVFNNVITDGHLDIVLLLYEGIWYPYWNGVGFWDTTDTVLSAGPDAKATRPDNAKWDFLGAAGGEPVWIFPETFSSTTPWPGVGAYDNQPGDFAPYFESDPRIHSTAEWLKLQLLAVRGPEGGHFSLYQGGLTDPVAFMTTANGIGADDAAWIRNLDHVHYHWAFTKPGLYQVDVVASAYVDFNQSGRYEPGVDPLSESQVFTLHFAVEVAPSVSRIPDQTFAAASTPAPIPVQVRDLETPPDDLVVTVTSSNQDVIPNSGIVLGGTGESRTLQFPTALTREGQTQITLRVVDGSGLVTTSSFVVTVQKITARSDLSLSLSGDRATLAIATQSGRIHQIESAPTPEGPWINLGDPINGTGETVAIVVPLDGSGGFFRWRIVGNP
jgi:surface-anchored protein